jgi:hypothetical protein
MHGCFYFENFFVSLHHFKVIIVVIQSIAIIRPFAMRVTSSIIHSFAPVHRAWSVLPPRRR